MSSIKTDSISTCKNKLPRTTNTIHTSLRRVLINMLFFLPLAGCYSIEPEKTTHKGETMPELNLFLADSSTYFNTSSIPSEKPAVLFYFGPRCPYSHAQIQDIIDEMEKLRNIQFIVFTTAPFYQMKWFYEKYKLNEYPNIKTGVDFNNLFRNYFNISSVPYIAVYGKNKKLKEAFSGKTPIRQIKDIAED